jgi:hypothetical protein
VVAWRDDTRHESLELFVATAQKLAKLVPDGPGPVATAARNELQLQD